MRGRTTTRERRGVWEAGYPRDIGIRVGCEYPKRLGYATGRLKPCVNHPEGAGSGCGRKGIEVGVEELLFV